VLQVTAGSFVAGGSTYTAIQQGGTSAGVIIDGTTLSVGETVTIAGDTISFSPSGLIEINADGSTSTIPLMAFEMRVSPSTEVEALLTLSHAGDVDTLTAYQLAGERGVVEIDGHALSVGGDALTTAGVTISLKPGGYLIKKIGRGDRMGNGAVCIRHADETWLAVEVWSAGYCNEKCFSGRISRPECDRC
jgi:hypothetical protein